MKFQISFLLFIATLHFTYSQNNDEKPLQKDSITSKSVAALQPTYLNMDKVYTEADQIPEYPGGINAFRTKLASTFNLSKINERGSLETEITFVVDKSGKITTIKAKGNSNSLNKEAIRAIKSMKQVWTSAKIDNLPVNYLFRLPLKMNI